LASQRVPIAQGAANGKESWWKSKPQGEGALCVCLLR
jgi:hypothetical protein